MHIYGEDWPLLVVETLSPIPGVVRYMLVVMSTRLPLVVMMCAILLYALLLNISSDINASMFSTTHCTCLYMTGRADNLTSNPREVGYLLVWKTIMLE